MHLEMDSLGDIRVCSLCLIRVSEETIKQLHHSA